MRISYEKLFILLRRRKIKKTELAAKARISSSTLAKLGHDEMVSLDVLLRICEVLHVNFGDIMDAVPDDQEDGKEIQYE